MDGSGTRVALDPARLRVRLAPANLPVLHRLVTGAAPAPVTPSEVWTALVDLL